MEVADLSFENVEGYQQECLLLSKSHFFNKQVIQQQSHQRKELAKVIEVQEIHFWETPSASFHEMNAAQGSWKWPVLSQQSSCASGCAPLGQLSILVLHSRALGKEQAYLKPHGQADVSSLVFPQLYII